MLRLAYFFLLNRFHQKANQTVDQYGHITAIKTHLLTATRVITAIDFSQVCKKRIKQKSKVHKSSD